MKLRLWSVVASVFLTQGVGAAYFAFRTDYPAVYDVTGFDWLSRLEVFRIFDGPGKSHAFERDGRKYAVVWNAEANRITIEENGNGVVVFALRPLLERLRTLGTSVNPQSVLTLETSAPLYRARLVIEDVSLEWGEGTPILHHLKGDLLFHRRRPGERTRIPPP